MLAGRRPAGHWGCRADLDPQWSMLRKQCELETRWRHKCEDFVPHFCSEVHVMIPETFYERYVQLPWWWADVELPYGLRPEKPRAGV